MYNILIIEDDNDINNMICDAFTKSGFKCKQAFSGTEGLLYVRSSEFDLAVLDLMLPGMSGEEVVSQIKEEKDIPVIIVSAKDSTDSKVRLLTSGADDYLTKPFAIRELIVRAMLQIEKNGKGNSRLPNTLKVGDLSLDRATFCAKVGKVRVPLTRQEFNILELLMLHPHKVYTKQEIYDYAWGDIFVGEDKTVNVHISNIRKKLRAASGNNYIETVWGIGFKLL